MGNLVYVITVNFEILPGEVDRFLEKMRENARCSVEVEPGCRQFDVCQSQDLPNTIFLYEVYDSEGAFKAHLASSHFKAFDREVAPLVAAKSVNALRRLWP